MSKAETVLAWLDEIQEEFRTAKKNGDEVDATLYAAGQTIVLDQWIRNIIIEALEKQDA